MTRYLSNGHCVRVMWILGARPNDREYVLQTMPSVLSSRGRSNSAAVVLCILYLPNNIDLKHTKAVECSHRSAMPYEDLLKDLAA